jgi:SH3 domain protein
VLRFLGLFLLLAASATVFAEDTVRYVTDELAIALRDGPNGEGPTRGVLTSGARVVVLESRPSGYAKVRAADGREAWIQEKYLKDEPIARARVDRAEKDLAVAQAELKQIKEDHARLLEDFARISGGEPVASRELVAETEKLRAELADRERQAGALKERYSAARAQQQTLLLGGGLVIVGGLLALLLRWAWPKKRWGDF